MNRIELDERTIEIPETLLSDSVICGIFFKSESARNQFGRKMLIQIKRVEDKKKSAMISDLKIGFNEDATIVDNLKIQRLILDLKMEPNILNQVFEKSNLLDKQNTKFRDISEINKLILGFNNQTIDIVDTLILNEWPAVVSKKSNIDTSNNLMKYLNGAKRKIILSTDDDLIRSVANVKFEFKNGKLNNYDF